MVRSSTGTPSIQGQTGRLFRQDRLIASNTISATFASWHDRIIAVFVLVVTLLSVRAWFANQPWTIATCAAVITGILSGIGVERLIATRLAFHASDGVLAADALSPPTRRHYRTAWHGAGLTLLIALTLIARPSLLVVSLPGYVAGAFGAGLTSGLAMPKRTAGATRPGWALRAWSHRPVAGATAALVLLLLLLPARALDRNVHLVVAGFGTAMLSLMLSSIDDAIVRFMTVAGHGLWEIVVRHGKGIAAFLVALTLGCFPLQGPAVASIVAVTGAAILVLLTLRVLAYRLHGRRFADFLVSILTGVLMLVAYSMPVALPVMALVLFWQLHRRGRTKTWLLA